LVSTRAAALTGLPVARLKLLSEQILVDRFQLAQRAKNYMD